MVEGRGSPLTDSVVSLHAEHLVPITLCLVVRCQMGVPTGCPQNFALFEAFKMVKAKHLKKSEYSVPNREKNPCDLFLFGTAGTYRYRYCIITSLIHKDKSANTLRRQTRPSFLRTPLMIGHRSDPGFVKNCWILMMSDVVSINGVSVRSPIPPNIWKP